MPLPAIGEAIEGSEAAFARRMNRTAKELGMSRTTFKNANGLTEAGHLSTARDMSVLGRHLFYDFPEYYNIFSRKTADAGVATVHHTNSRFLSAYPGADGIKTGYTAAAGFNLVASAQHGNERIITTVFGGRSTAARNAKVTELMDLGFKRASTNVSVSRPKKPPYLGKVGGEPVLVAEGQTAPAQASKIIRVSINISKSPLPKPRPLRALAPEDEQMLLAASDDVFSALAKADNEAKVLAAATAATVEATAILAEAAQVTPAPAPTISRGPSIVPTPRPEQLQLASLGTTSVITNDPVPTGPEVVTRISTSGNRHWGHQYRHLQLRIRGAQRAFENRADRD